MNARTRRALGLESLHPGETAFGVDLAKVARLDPAHIPADLAAVTIQGVMVERHKPKIQHIEIQARVWQDGDRSFAVGFSRWSGYTADGKTKHFSCSIYFHPTQASLARVLRAQIKLVG